MTIYTAIYDDKGTLLKDDLSSSAWSLEKAYKEAKEIAKKNGWKVKVVMPKVYPLTPQVNYPRPYPLREPWDEPLVMH